MFALRIQTQFVGLIKSLVTTVTALISITDPEFVGSLMLPTVNKYNTVVSFDPKLNAKLNEIVKSSQNVIKSAEKNVLSFSLAFRILK